MLQAPREIVSTLLLGYERPRTIPQGPIVQHLHVQNGNVLITTQTAAMAWKAGWKDRPPGKRQKERKRKRRMEA